VLHPEIAQTICDSATSEDRPKLLW